LASVIYEAAFKVAHIKLTYDELKREKSALQRVALVSPAFIFVALELSTRTNPICAASASMFIGALITLVCRPDLEKKILVGGLMFAGLYFLFYLCVGLLAPHFVLAWNFAALSGVIIVDVPLEEVMFAFTFGTLWSSAYEHINGYRLKNVTRSPD